MTSTRFDDYSPPIESVGELLSIFSKGESTPDQWRLGTEHEKLGFHRRTLKPVGYEGPQGIRMVLEQFVSRFGWEPVFEGANIIALARGAATISLEPGGQFELSGAPLPSTHGTCQELTQHLAELREISEALDLVWLSIGRNPFVPSGEMPWMPKQRYAVMRNYLPKRGSMGIDMMVGTGTVQTNLDYSSEADMAMKMRVGMAASPILTALFANSPLANGTPTGYLSTRALIWQHTDPDRSGILPAVFQEDFSYQDYVDYALDVPMFFIYRAGHYIDCAGYSFREFLSRGLEGERPTEADWALHLTTIFPEVRLKGYLELRMADAGAPDMICALSALTRGMFYDATALSEAVLLLQNLTAEELPSLIHEAAQVGLRARALGRPLQDWARELVAIAHGGLQRLNACDGLGQNEVKYLAPLEEIVTSGKCRAEVLLEQWHGAWQRDPRKLLQACCL